MSKNLFSKSTQYNPFSTELKSKCIPKCSKSTTKYEKDGEGPLGDEMLHRRRQRSPEKAGDSPRCGQREPWRARVCSKMWN